MEHVSINDQNMPNLITRHEKSNVENQLRLETEVYHTKLVEVTNESQDDDSPTHINEREYSR